jgi:hypothetical protein
VGVGRCQDSCQVGFFCDAKEQRIDKVKKHTTSVEKLFFLSFALGTPQPPPYKLLLFSLSLVLQAPQHQHNAHNPRFLPRQPAVSWSILSDAELKWSRHPARSAGQGRHSTARPSKCRILTNGLGSPPYINLGSRTGPGPHG